MTAATLTSVAVLSAAALASAADVLVVGDGPASAPAGVRPSPGNPIAYVIVSAREHPLGDPVAGEPKLVAATVEREITAALARLGYVKTGEVGGPLPALALFITWGTANLVVEEAPDFTSPSTRGRALALGVDDGVRPGRTYVHNRDEIAWLIGENKRATPLSRGDGEGLNADATDHRYYVSVVALDAVALAHHQKKLVWQTRASVVARRTSLPESIHGLLVDAAPYFGRNTEPPVTIRDVDRRNAAVHIGTPTVVEESTGSAGPATTKPKN